jgi:hypothetical protein
MALFAGFRPWLIGIALLVVSVYALGILVETPKAAPECSWGASSIVVNADGRVVGPHTSGCVPR